MAKQASTNGASKSDLIRNYKSSHQDAGPTAIAAALTKEGTKVTPAFVSTVLSNAKRKGRKGGRKMGRRKMVRRGRQPAVVAKRSNDPVDRLIQAKKLAQQMGGVEQARAALDALAKILA